METMHSATTCRWAMPTLFLQPPLWLQATDYPWSCTRDIEPRPLLTTDECQSCPRWQPQCVETRQTLA